MIGKKERQSIEHVRDKIKTLGRWHLKRTKSEATKIWKILFADIQDLLNEKRPFSNTTNIKLIVRPKKQHYTFVVNKPRKTVMHSYIAKKDYDYESIITEISLALAKYSLQLVPTSDKKPNPRILNPQIEYTVEVVYQ